MVNLCDIPYEVIEEYIIANLDLSGIGKIILTEKRFSTKAAKFYKNIMNNSPFLREYMENYNIFDILVNSSIDVRTFNSLVIDNKFLEIKFNYTIYQNPNDTITILSIIKTRHPEYNVEMTNNLIDFMDQVFNATYNIKSLKFSKNFAKILHETSWEKINIKIYDIYEIYILFLSNNKKLFKTKISSSKTIESYHCNTIKTIDTTISFFINLIDYEYKIEIKIILTYEMFKYIYYVISSNKYSLKLNNSYFKAMILEKIDYFQNAIEEYYEYPRHPRDPRRLPDYFMKLVIDELKILEKYIKSKK